MIRRAFTLFPWLQRDRAARALAEDYRRVFAGEAGRRVLADILNKGCIAQDTAMLHDERRVAAVDGRRQLALEIFDLAGGARDRLADAVISDNIKEALNVPNDFADPNAGRRAIDPVRPYDDDDDAVIAAGGD